MSRRTRIPALLAATAVSALLASGCSALTNDSGDAASSDEIAAAFYPLAYAAERVAGSHLEVTNLTEPGKEAHDVALSVKSTADVADAALVVFLADFQPAIDEAVEQNAKGRVLDAAKAVTLQAYDDRELAGAHTEDDGHDHGDHGDHAPDDHDHDAPEHGEDDGAHDGHDHGDLDSHFWQDPLLMADFADAIADELSEVDPDHADDFSANAATFRDELEQLDADYTRELARCQRNLVVVNHDAFGYLTRYGLEFETITGLTPGAEPTIADRSRLQELIADEGITTVFSESLSSDKAATSVAKDAGVKAEVLDPIEGLSDLTKDEDYLSLMRANLAKLTRANGC